jgi:hypothetical protein
MPGFVGALAAIAAAQKAAQARAAMAEKTVVTLIGLSPPFLNDYLVLSDPNPRSLGWPIGGHFYWFTVAFRLIA